MITYYKETPLGLLEIMISEQGVHRLQFAPAHIQAADVQTDHPVAQQLERELEEYFAGKLRNFFVPVVLSGGDFALKVLCVLRSQVPYGSTITYGDLALAAGHPGAARAVGNVMHDNQLLLLVPCHRVLPKNGGPGCYAGREDVKIRLLELERAHKL